MQKARAQLSAEPRVSCHPSISWHPVQMSPLTIWFTNTPAPSC